MHGQPHACGCPGEQDEKGGKRHTAGAITDQTDMLLYASMRRGAVVPKLLQRTTVSQGFSCLAYELETCIPWPLGCCNLVDLNENNLQTMFQVATMF